VGTSNSNSNLNSSSSSNTRSSSSMVADLPTLIHKRRLSVVDLFVTYQPPMFQHPQRQRIASHACTGVCVPVCMCARTQHKHSSQLVVQLSLPGPLPSMCCTVVRTDVSLLR
jgi:hypothetical protein